MAKAKATGQERCYGCDAQADTHPKVAVMSRGDVEPGRALEHDKISQRGFVSVPVCQACHENPDHRTRPIKAHFFDRDQVDTALVNAGASNLSL